MSLPLHNTRRWRWILGAECFSETTSASSSPSLSWSHEVFSGWLPLQGWLPGLFERWKERTKRSDISQNSNWQSKVERREEYCINSPLGHIDSSDTIYPRDCQWSCFLFPKWLYLGFCCLVCPIRKREKGYGSGCLFIQGCIKEDCHLEWSWTIVKNFRVGLLLFFALSIWLRWWYLLYQNSPIRMPSSSVNFNFQKERCPSWQHLANLDLIPNC